MTELNEIAKAYQVSRPIFRLTKGRRDSSISANTGDPVYKFRPVPQEGDVLSELVAEHFRENFYPDIGVFSMDPDEIVKGAMNDIRNSMSTFLEKNLDMRSPTQSKVYRWYYRSMPNNTYFNDVLVKVYKYMRTFTDSSMKGHDEKHVTNTIALLGAIMEKYNEEN